MIAILRLAACFASGTLIGTGGVYCTTVGVVCWAVALASCFKLVKPSPEKIDAQMGL